MTLIFTVIVMALGMAFLVGQLCAEDNRRKEDL